MREMLAVTWLQLRLILKNKGLLITMIILPLAFTAVMSLSSGSKPTALAVVNNDGSFAAERLVETLRADKSLAVSTAAGSAVDGLLADHKAAAALIIPTGFERSIAAGPVPTLQIVETPGSEQYAVRLSVANASEVVAATYQAALASVNAIGGVQAAYATVAASHGTILIDQAAAGNAGDGGGASELTERTLGFAVMFVMMATLMQGGALLEQRKSGAWGRILTSAASQSAALFGLAASLAVAALIQFTGLAVVSHLLFRVHWGALLPLMALAVALSLCAAALSVLLANLARTPEQHGLLAMLLAILTAMLGGAYWSLDLVSPFLRKLGHVTPQAWTLDALRALALHRGGWAEVAGPVAVLLAFALVSAAAGTIRLSGTRKKPAPSFAART